MGGCWLLLVATVYLGWLGPLRLARAQAQSEPTTAEQVIARYKEAIGADRFQSITTFEERGEVYGNLTNFWQGSSSPRQSQMKEVGTFEFYFKAPNLRFQSTVNDKKQVVGMYGCDGKVSWSIDAFMRRSEFKPKPGNEYSCKAGFERMPAFISEPKAKLRLTKKKEVGGRLAWEVKVDVAKSAGTETFYFDAETYLLLREDMAGYSLTYSDYRDVGGIKFAFVTVSQSDNSKLVTTVRELRVNPPIEDARFTEPDVKGQRVEFNGSVPGVGTTQPKPAQPARPAESSASQVSAASTAADSAQQSASNQTRAAESSAMQISDLGHHEAGASAETTPLKPKSSSNGAPPGSGGAPANGAGNAAAVSASEVNFPNFTACSFEELQLAVPELQGLKRAQDQEKLTALLGQVGDRTVEEARHTPDLISLETVAESQQGAGETRREYDYLILSRVEGNVVGLNEFRVDRKTGDRFQTDEAMKTEPTLAELERASHEVTASATGRPPMSQGFANSWVHFYPRNRGQASFRYLGEQKMDGQRTVVLAFAQKPGSVLTPALFRSKEKTVPMYLQGVAWVSAADFRILRLRTDLLSPLPEVSLHRLTTETQFAGVKIEGVGSILWLPRDVMVTSEAQGVTLREDHTYSEYRLFRAKSKVVLNR